MPDKNIKLNQRSVFSASQGNEHPGEFSQLKKRILSTLPPGILKILDKNTSAGFERFDWIVSQPKNYHDPLLLPDIGKAVQILEKAITSGEKIALFGDKDVDGITALAAMSRFFDSLQTASLEKSAKSSVFSYTIFFAEEEDADYGLTEKIVREVQNSGCSLLLTLDTGTSDFQAIELARGLGLEVIVIDHHEQRGDLPIASALVNPKRQDSVYPFTGLATAALVLKLCHAFLISSGKGQVFIWEVKDKLFIELRKKGEIHCFDSMAQLQNFLGALPGSGYKTELKWVVSNPLLKQRLKENFEELGVYAKVELWLEIKNVINGSFTGSNDTRDLSGFDFWGNPLTGFNGLDLLRCLFNIPGDGLFHEISFPRAYQILQMSISKKIYSRLFNLLPLVAMGTLADMMPLEGENRMLVRSGIMQIRRGRDQWFQIITDRMGIWSKRLRSRNMSWSIIPVLNSPGRLGSGKETLDFFLSKDPAQREHCLEDLLEKNRQRRNWVEIGKQEVIRQVTEDKQNGQNKLIVALTKDMPFGITGLVASRVAEHFAKPAVVMIQKGEKIVGSARSNSGVNVLAMVSSARAHLTLYGGHKEAAGFSFKESEFPAVVNCLKEFAESFPQGEKDCLRIAGESKSIEIDIKDIDFHFLEQLDWLEPFGMGSAEPLFLIKNIPAVNFKILGKDKLHGKFAFQIQHSHENSKEASLLKGFNHQTIIEVIGWGLAKEMEKIYAKGEPFSVLGELDLNYFRGEVKINVILSKIVEN